MEPPADSYRLTAGLGKHFKNEISKEFLEESYILDETIRVDDESQILTQSVRVVDKPPIDKAPEVE